MQSIAVVGLSCRFPAADNAAAYWDLLTQGIDAIVEVPPDRWDIQALYDKNTDAPGRVCTKWGGFLRDVDQFDASFFNISPREAERVDPQQRLILEVAWEALESAGIPPERLSGSDAGVFVAISHSDYARLINSDWSRIIAYNGAGMYPSIAANRLSYTLNLHGPSMVVDTACSSSLVAVHVACQHLRLHETSLAIVGGVNLNLDPVETIGLTKGKMLSPDGRCRTFDDAANGYVRSDGCGVVVLKRLDDALRDADPIRAVIHGSAVNHDGLTNGLYAPSGPAQQAVIRKALCAAGVAPADISYVEAHGTGTALGDPIEMRSLMTVLGEDRPREKICWVGSVKTNVGHLEAASGMAGLIKTVLALEHEEIPRHLHLHKLNRYIKLDGTAFKIPVQPVPWPSGARKAGVSAFGFGGTNAHIILEEAPVTALAANCTAGVPELLTLSAKTEPALRAMADAYRKQLSTVDADALPTLRDLCYTANYGRSHFKQRLAIAADSIADVVAALDDFTHGRATPNWYTGVTTKQATVGFLFTGQGSQYAGMGRGLHGQYPVYREHFNHCARILKDSLDVSLEELVFGPDAEAYLSQTGYAQPALFALEYALARQLITWGFKPDVLLGHSLSEIVAACVAGVVPLEQVLKFVVTRARLMQSLPAGGAMLAVSARAELAEQLLRDNDAPSVRVAAYNGPANFVLSGRETEIRKLEEVLRAHVVPHARLQVSHAFHSGLIAPIADELRAAAAALTISSSSYKIVSNVTGQLAVVDQYREPQYWVDHAMSPVMFWPGVQTLLKNKCTLLIEVGPHSVLSAALGPVLADTDVRLAGTLRRGCDDRSQLTHMLAKAYVWGAVPDWASYERGFGGRVISLPNYPFQRQRHWYDVDRSVTQPAPNYVAEVGLRTAPYLADHRVNGKVVLPATAYLELALAAGRQLIGEEQPLVLENVEFKRACVINNDGSSKTLSFSLGGKDGTAAPRSFVISDAAGEYVSGTLSTSSSGIEPALFDPGIERVPWCTSLDVDDYYEQLHDIGLQYGPAFRGITGWRLDGSVNRLIGRVALPKTANRAKAALHPALLDACLQFVGVLADEAGLSGLFLPAALARFRIVGTPQEGTLQCRVELAKTESSCLHANIEAFDSAGRLVCEMKGLRLELIQRASEISHWQFVPTWLPAESAAGARRESDDLLMVSGRPIDIERLPKRFTEQFRSIVVARTRTSFDSLVSPEHRPTTVVFLSEVADAPIPSDQVLPDCMVLVELVKALSGATLQNGFRLVVVTRDAHRVVENDVPNPLQTAIWGLARVVAMECPKLACRVIDLAGDHLPWEAISHAIQASGPDFQFAWRGHLAYRFNLVKVDGGTSLPAMPFRLALANYGELESLAYRSIDNAGTPPLGETELEIQVRATGLNFRDVLNALGSLKSDLASADIEEVDQIPFGGECAGVVTRVGSRAGKFAVGEAVIVALTPGCLASTVRAPMHRVIKKPEGIGFAAAATISTAYLTAYHAFRNCARVRPGERVLVHAASGSVGQAALAYLRHLGAMVYATTSAEKRAYVQNQGVAAVLDSRSPSVGGEIRKLTGGKGVDVVLNSLSGDFIPASLDVLAPGGVFVEIGKRGAWTEEQVRDYRPDVRYVQFDLLALDQREPALIATLLAQIQSDLAAGRISPLPHALYPARHVTAAFRYLAGARHIGKVVVAFEEATRSSAAVPARLDSEGAYLVTGGLGVLGLRLAAWLLSEGALHIVLVGRHDPTALQKAEIDRLTACGGAISVLRLDIAERTACEQIEAYLAGLGLPLRGMFHLAGMIDDAVLVNQSAAKFRRVMAPKIDGAWNLHLLGKRFADAFLVCYSSVASLVGSPGQANYAVANSFLDGLADYRRAVGLHGLSINWGPFEQVGLVVGGDAQARTARFLTQAGLRPINWRTSARLLKQYLSTQATRVAVMPVDAAVFAKKMARDYPQVLGLFQGLGVGLAPTDRNAGIAEALKKAGRSDAFRRINEVVKEHLAAVLRMSAVDVDTGQTWSQLGVDSLLAMEVKAKLDNLFGTNIDDALTLQSATVKSVAARIHKHMFDGELSPHDDTGDAAVRPTTESYVAYYRPREAPRARLICFHHLGGSAAVYRDWSELLPEAVELVPVQLPGRENRSLEPPVTAFETLIPAIVHDLLSYLDQPFALYGHSMGSLIAYEVCRHLERHHHLRAEYLFVGGLWAPVAHSRELERRVVSPSAVMVDAEVPAAVLGDKALSERLSQIFDGDCELFKNYRYLEDSPLSVGITGFYGSADNVASYNDLLGWQGVSSKPLVVHAVEGRHMFHKTNPAAVIAAMAVGWPVLETDNRHEPPVPDMVTAHKIRAHDPLVS